MGGGDLCAEGLPGKTIVSVGQTSGRTNPIVTRLSDGRTDRPRSGGEVSTTGELLGRKRIPGSDKRSFTGLYSNSLWAECSGPEISLSHE